MRLPLEYTITYHIYVASLVRQPDVIGHHGLVITLKVQSGNLLCEHDKLECTEFPPPPVANISIEWMKDVLSKTHDKSLAILLFHCVFDALGEASPNAYLHFRS